MQSTLDPTLVTARFDPLTSAYLPAHNREMRVAANCAPATTPTMNVPRPSAWWTYTGSTGMAMPVDEAGDDDDGHERQQHDSDRAGCWRHVVSRRRLALCVSCFLEHHNHSVEPARCCD